MKKILVTLLMMTCACSFVNAQYVNTKMKVGQKAPDLSFPDPTGKKLKLSEINKGRYVLVDFWASWCHPCRMANPGLVKMYNEYAGKKFKKAKNGFTVVSVSLDQDKGAWLGAIKQDNLSWPYHMSDLKYWQSKAAEIYGVQFVPQAFLVDPNGKILGKYMAAEEAYDDIGKYVEN